MREVKEIWIDCETTGVDVGRNGLIQVAGDIIINDVIKETFNIRMNAGNKVLDQESLDVIKKTPQEIAAYQSPVDAYREFKRILSRFVNPYDKKDKFEWFGYNPNFDIDFMRQWFIENHDKYFGSWFWMPAYDIWQLAVHKMRAHRQEFENTKLWTMAKWYGVDVDKFTAHDAASDISVSRELYYKILSYPDSKA